MPLPGIAADRKKIAKEARLAKRNAKESNNGGGSYVPKFGGALKDWRLINGGVKIKEDEEEDEDAWEREQEQMELLDKLYQDALAKKLSKIQSENKKELQEFEDAIKRVKRQIEMQHLKDAKIRRSKIVKYPNGYLLSGDAIEKVTYDEQDNIPSAVYKRKSDVQDWSERMASIVTVRIDSGESVEVAIKNTAITRTENGPQVLILASNEQLVAATFSLTNKNASFKPEFTWQVMPAYNYSGPSQSSYSFDSPTPSFGYSIPSDNNYSFSSNGYGFHDDQGGNRLGYDIVMDNYAKPALGYDFGDGQQVKNIHSFGDEDDDSTRGNLYSFEMDDGYGRTNKFTLEYDEDDKRGPSKDPDIRLQEIEYLLTEIDRLKGVFAEGFMSMSDYARKMDELSEGAWNESDPVWEKNIESELAEVRLEAERRKASFIPAGSDQRERRFERKPKQPQADQQPQQQQQRLQRQQGMQNRPPNARMQPRREREPRVPRPPRIPRPAPPRRRFSIDSGSIDMGNWDAASEQMSYAKPLSESENKLMLCEQVLEYLQRYQRKPKPTASADAKNDKPDADEHDYLSSSFFLTDEEDGHYYEKQQERIKRKKKKTKKAKKTLYHTTGIFTQFAVLDMFPPQTIAQVPEAVEKLESLKEKLSAKIVEEQAAAAAAPAPAWASTDPVDWGTPQSWVSPSEPDNNGTAWATQGDDYSNKDESSNKDEYSNEHSRDNGSETGSYANGDSQRDESSVSGSAAKWEGSEVSRNEDEGEYDDGMDLGDLY